MATGGVVAVEADGRQRSAGRGEHGERLGRFVELLTNSTFVVAGVKCWEHFSSSPV